MTNDDLYLIFINFRTEFIVILKFGT